MSHPAAGSARLAPRKWGEIAARGAEGGGAMSKWLAFWEGDNPIYVSERHRRVHYARVAEDIRSVLPPEGDGAVLDYGCGEALEAGRVAAHCARLYLYDASRTVRARLLERFEGAAGLAVLDEDGLAALGEAALDVVVVNSVIQYLAREELMALLERALGWLKRGGALVLADVVPPGPQAAADAKALLATAWRHGFLGAALIGLVRAALSDYRRLRAEAGFAAYGEAEMLALLKDAGFAARRRRTNFGFNPARMTFIATRPR